MFLVSRIGSRKLFYLLLCILLLKALFAALILLFSGMDLSPDEAQYWTWSQSPAISYYSKPPLIAWQIFLTTKLFGNTLFGVRFGALFLNFLLSLTIWRLARLALFSAEIAFWAALCFAFSPFGIFFAFPATTDLGAILFFTLAIGEVSKGLQTEETQPNYLLPGLFIFFGALYKWVVYAFWPFIFILAIFYKKMRQKTLIGGVLISLCGLLPSLIWNSSHDFATFKHVFYTFFKPAGHRSAKVGNFIDFFSAQMGLIFPIFFILMCIGVFLAYRSRKKLLILLAIFPTGVLLYLLNSLFKKIQPNWALYLYPSGFVLAAWAANKKGRIWLPIGLFTSLAFCLFTLSIPFIQEHNIFPRWQIPYKVNPFRQTLGWRRLTQSLELSGYDPEKDFLFSDKYQITSILSFYEAGQKRAYFLNLGSSRKNQFTYWPGMNPGEVGKTGYFVLAENSNNFEEALPWYISHYAHRLQPYFESVEVAGIEPLFDSYGKTVKFAIIFRCTSYNGKEPPPSKKY